MMSKTAKLLAGAATLAFMSAGTAQAAGTAAGTDVANTFSLEYKAGSSPTVQTYATPNTVTFKVDRVVDLTVDTTTPTVAVTAGQANAEQVFVVTNTGNAPQAYDIDLNQTSGDNFNTTPTTVAYHIDLNNDGIVDTGETTGTYSFDNGAIVASGDVPADASIRLTVTSSVPGTATNNQVGALSLVANTLEDSGGTFGTAGAEVAATTPTGAGLATVETVLNDGQDNNQVGGVTYTPTPDEDADNDGAESAVSRLQIQIANVTAVKSVALIYENDAGGALDCGTATPVASASRYIPGACVEYTITVTNTGAAIANDIEIDDELKEQLTFVTSSTAGLGTTTTSSSSAQCAYSGAPASTNCTTASMTDGTLAAGNVSATSGTFTIRATIN